MSTKAIEEMLRRLDGPDHHDRDELLRRNGRWGTCVDCPRDARGVYPERCKHTKHYDHQLRRPNAEAWTELEAIRKAAATLSRTKAFPYAAASVAAWALVDSIAKETP